jgi:hypothetical protein
MSSAVMVARDELTTFGTHLWRGPFVANIFQRSLKIQYGMPGYRKKLIAFGSDFVHTTDNDFQSFGSRRRYPTIMAKASGNPAKHFTKIFENSMMPLYALLAATPSD